MTCQHQGLGSVRLSLLLFAFPFDISCCVFEMADILCISLSLLPLSCCWFCISLVLTSLHLTSLRTPSTHPMTFCQRKIMACLGDRHRKCEITRILQNGKGKIRQIGQSNMQEKSKWKAIRKMNDQKKKKSKRYNVHGVGEKCDRVTEIKGV